MKMNFFRGFIVLLGFAIVSFFVGCAGKEGPMGPAGKDGITTIIYITNHYSVKTNVATFDRTVIFSHITNCVTGITPKTNTPLFTMPSFLIQEPNLSKINVNIDSVLYYEPSAYQWLNNDYVSGSNYLIIYCSGPFFPDGIRKIQISWPEQISITNYRPTP